MVRPARERLNGKVEVDESYVGMHDLSKLLKGAKLMSDTSRSLVAIAVEMQEPKGFGRIRLRRISGPLRRTRFPLCAGPSSPGQRCTPLNQVRMQENEASQLSEFARQTEHDRQMAPPGLLAVEMRH